jgi:hypothetical protein
MDAYIPRDDSCLREVCIALHRRILFLFSHFGCLLLVGLLVGPSTT